MKISLGHIQTQLSSSVQYGLVVMKTKVGYKPSDHFLRVYKPISDQEKQEALLDSLLKPELYHKLIMQFKGGMVPSIPALATILFRGHSIAEAASEAAAKIFIENLQYLKLLDSENHLLLNPDFGNSLEQDESVEEKDVKNSNTGKPQVVLYTDPQRKEYDSRSEVTVVEQPQSYPIPIPLKGGRQAKLIIPESFTNEDLDKIMRFIDALRE